MSTEVQTAVAAPATQPPRRHSGVAAAIASRGALLAVLVALVAVFAAINGRTFFSADNLRLILTSQAAVGVIALAVCVALVINEVDLSVAGVMGAVAGVVAQLVSNGTAPVLAILAGLAFAAAFGLVNGLLVTYARLSSIIATLATGTLATGFGLAIVGPITISGLSPGFLNLFSSSLGGVQTAFYLLVVLIAAAALILQRTLLGRRLFFIGQNRDAAALLGIGVRRLTIGSLVAASMLAGLAGIMLVGQNGGANVTQTSGYLLPAFAAAFLGTSAIVPGRFNAVGTFVAVYVLGTATVGLNMAGVATWSTYVFNGGLLIFSLGLFTMLKIRKEQQARRDSMRAATATAADDD